MHPLEPQTMQTKGTDWPCTFRSRIHLSGGESGPVPVPTWTGKAYAFVAVQMGSRMGVGELLETENDADESLKAIVSRLERQLD